MSFWRQTSEIARSDLIAEWRSGFALRINLPFALVALMIFPISTAIDLALTRSIAIPVFWAVAVLFGTQLGLRVGANTTLVQRDVEAIIGVDPVARMIGHVWSGLVSMVIYLIVLAVGVLTLYSPELPPGFWPVFLAAAGLFGLGLVQLSVLAGEVSFGLRGRTALAQLMALPLAIPLVYGASQSIEALSRDTSILPWMLLLLASNLALTVISVASAEPLEEAAR